MIGTALLLAFATFMLGYVANSAGSYRISRNYREK